MHHTPQSGPDARAFNVGRGLKIGFLSNQLDNRGTGDALYKYAHYNEELLGNKSFIFTLENGNHDEKAYQRFVERFDNVYHPGWDYSMVDAIYHIKSGYDDGLSFNNIPYLVHSVFDNQPHGTVYATVSPWMGQRYGLEYVPHIVELADTSEDLRERLEIPKDAVVFGRHGGADTFDIDFVKDEIKYFLETTPGAYFLFLNTDRFMEHPNVIHLPATVDPINKRKFINTCDAMIHARSRGETFGLSVGEFAITGKPVITYSESQEKAHLQELGHFALTYKNGKELTQQLDKIMAGPLLSWGYGNFTPYKVMMKFNEVFLSCLK